MMSTIQIKKQRKISKTLRSQIIKMRFHLEENMILFVKKNIFLIVFIICNVVSTLGNYIG
jgi:hypothetical protein